MSNTFKKKEDLYEFLAQSKDIDDSFYSVIIDILRREKISDCLEFLSNPDNEKHYEQYILQVKNLSFVEKEQKLLQEKSNIQKITNLIQKILDHDFNENNYSQETYTETRQELIKKIQENQKIRNFFQFLVNLTALDNKLIRC
ncbi:unnamed protein product [Paramecium primaurelia]|uniref:Uncharacterized protein n=1 Tax=Paramecium primaurelia TaxID=5886 RepID=A0A8S1QRX2_PARPR|nr:unnamed protein product [Paramecium primaurelia]